MAKIIEAISSAEVAVGNSLLHAAHANVQKNKATPRLHALGGLTVD
jgi:hypothetical protein